MASDSLSPADQAAVTTDAIVDRAKHLGLTWGLRMATVVDGSNPQAVVATYDGDDTAIGMVSMVGPLVVNARVYVLQVPPGGNFIVSHATGPTTQLGTQIGTGGTLLTTTAEAAILSASWAVEPTFVFPPGRIFTAVMVGGVYTAAAADRICAIRLRKGAQTTAGTELAYRPWMVNLISGIGGSFAWNAFFKNSGTAAVSTKLSVTAVNPAGATGTVSLYGDTQQPLLVVVRDYCAISDDTSLAGVLASV